MNIYIETFGCTFNQADSQIMAGLLQEDGNELVDDVEDAEVLILNTCYVKQPTEQKVVNRIMKLQEAYPEKKFIISGCMVEIDQDKLEKIAPGASWVGPHKIISAPDMVKSVCAGKTVRLTGFEDVNKVCLPKIRSNELINIIQICEGCDGYCSYCCTRIARGNLKSYPVELVKQEAERAVREGCVEVQLTAQDTAAYGKDSGTSLSELVNAVTSVRGKFKVRVGMMHPKSVKNDADELIRAFKSDKVYKFIHIPLQSGNDQVLSDMNRGHSAQEFLDIISQFRREIPEISISTDIIVGYPTEDEEAFQDTLKVIEEIQPDFLHISKYHHRPGSNSSSLQEIEHQDMKKRSKDLNELKYAITLHNNEKLLGKVLSVLVTDIGRKGGFTGRTDSYKLVVVDDAPLGSFVDVEITEAKATYLKGHVISD